MAEPQCENPACDRPLRVDHVVLVTTKHVRRFCSVECIHESQQIHEQRIWESVRGND